MHRVCLRGPGVQAGWLYGGWMAGWRLDGGAGCRCPHSAPVLSRSEIQSVAPGVLWPTDAPPLLLSKPPAITDTTTHYIPQNPDNTDSILTFYDQTSVCLVNTSTYDSQHSYFQSVSLVKFPYTSFHHSRFPVPPLHLTAPPVLCANTFNLPTVRNYPPRLSITNNHNS